MVAAIQVTRRAIRSKDTGLWLTAEGLWTDDFSRANHFENISEAVFTAVRLNLINSEFVLRFDEKGYWDVAMDMF